MKPAIAFLIFLLFAISVFGQEEEKTKPSFPFNEFGISINRTNVSTYGNTDRLGCGAGMYRSFVAVRRLDFVFGVEYNYTSQFVEEISYGNVGYENDMTFHIHTISLPFFLRFSMGKDVKFFIESGIFLDIPIVSKKKGYRRISDTSPHPTYPWIPWPIYRNIEVNEKAGISDINYGPSLGMGVRIPAKSIELIIKADYKTGLNTFNANNLNLHNQYYRLSVGIRKRTT
jgi:hypothetical protein